jgi:hypothetical protein
MKREEYDKLSKQSKDGYVYGKARRILFRYPPLPDYDTLSPESKQLYREYEKYLKRYRRMVERQNKWELRILDVYGEILSINPEYKEYTPFVRFKTYEDLMETGGLEALSRWYVRVRSKVDKYAKLRVFKENYLRAFDQLVDSIALTPEEEREVEIIRNMIKRMSMTKLYTLMLANRIPSIEDFYPRHRTISDVKYITEKIRQGNKEYTKV